MARRAAAERSRRAITPAAFVAWTCATAGVLLCFVVPPFMIADEPAHFLRAWSVSLGRPGAEKRGAAAGGVLPASLGEQIGVLWTGLPGHPERKVDPRAIRRELRRPLAPGRTAFHDFTTASVVTPVPYLPQAAGILLGRLAGAPPLAAFYLARLANLLAGTLLLVLAVRALPACRWAAAMTAVAPIALTTLASVSADVVPLGAAFLVTAAAAKRALAPAESLRRSDWALLCGAGVALCLTKPPYALLALAPAIVPPARWPRGGRGPALAAGYAAAVVVACGVSLGSALAADVSARPDAAVDRQAQMREVVREPLRAAWIVAADAVEHGPRYALQLVGVQLGWLDTRLPLWLAAAYLAVLLALPGLDSGPPPPGLRLGRRLALLALATAAAAAVIASQWVTFTPSGAEYVEGVQGRYFLPLVPAAALALHRPRPGGAPRALPWLLAAWTVLTVAVTLRAILHRYYG